MAIQGKIKLTITLTRYDEPNWLALETLASLAEQQDIDADVLFLDQQQDPEFAQQISQLSNRWIRIKSIHIASNGLSYARNCGIARANSKFVLFIDCDAVAHEYWAIEIVNCLLSENVAIAGSRILPHWHKKPPLMAKSRVVWEQYSLLDFGPEIIDQPNIVGAGFGIDCLKMGKDAYFDEALGRRDGYLFGGEDSDLCTRALSAGHRVLYNGKSVITHQILPVRLRYTWLLKRLFYAGLNRSISGGAPKTKHNLNVWDYAFAPIIGPVYIAGYCLAKIRNTLSQARR